MHKYWSKKPHDAIRKYISKYSNHGDIVLDPFSGSGISVLESIFTDRKAIGIDINPAAVFITKQMLRKVPIELVEREFKRILMDVKPEIDSFYKIHRSGNIYTGTHYLWDKEKMIEIWYKDCRGKKITYPTENDLELFNSFSYEKVPYYYPKEKLFHNSRINANENMHIYDLFTPRNLHSLSIILNRINEIDDVEMNEFFKFCFTGSVGQASKMVFVIQRRGKNPPKNGSEVKKEVGSWVIGYWVPKEFFEINAWNCFQNRYHRVINGKRALSDKSFHLNYANSYSDLLLGKNILLINEPSQSILSDFPDNSIDYVITDPPHGNRQPYLELSMMWNSWLRNGNIDYQNEIVISDSKERRKNKTDYYRLLNEVFVQIMRVLKPDHFFSLMFSSLDDETWENIILVLSKLNLTLIEVNSMKYSARSVIQDTRKNGLKSDLIFTFKKTPRTINNIEYISVREKKGLFIEIINNVIHESNSHSVETYQILNYLITFFLYQHQYFRLSDFFLLINEEFIHSEGSWKMR